MFKKRPIASAITLINLSCHCNYVHTQCYISVSPYITDYVHIEFILSSGSVDVFIVNGGVDVFIVSGSDDVFIVNGGVDVYSEWWILNRETSTTLSRRITMHINQEQSKNHMRETYDITLTRQIIENNICIIKP